MSLRSVGPRGPWRALIIMHVCAAAALRAQVPAEVRGRVTDATNGRAVSGAVIELDGRSDRVTTAGDGVFLFRGLEPKAYHLRVRALGFTPAERDVVVANGRATSVSIELQATAISLAAVRVTGTGDERVTPGATTFDRRAIEQSGRRDVGELLQSVPSVVITQSGGPGSPTRISIRGSGSAEVLVLVDGVPVNSSITGAADLSRLNLETVERVTLLPGTQSARYGSRALAGVVVIETRRAQRELASAASVGAWGERAGTLTVGDAADFGGSRLSASVTGQRRAVDGDFAYDVPAVRGGGRARRFNSDVGSTNFLGTTSLETERTATRARVDWEDTDRGVAGSIVQPSATAKARERRLMGGIEARSTMGSVVVSTSADAAEEQSHYKDLDPPFGAPYDDRVDAHTVRGSTAANWAGRLGSIMVGAEARRLTVDATSLDSSVRAQNTTGIWLDARRSTDVGGGVLLTSEIATRADWESRVNGTSISPRATATAEKGRASLSLTMGNAFSPPSLADQFFHEGVLAQPNPNLAPERVRGEVEVRGALRDIDVGDVKVHGEAAAYRADITGMIIWQPNFRYVWSPSNFDVRRRGWEASVDAGVDRLGASLRGSISQTAVEYTGDVLHGQIAYRPKTTGSVAARLVRARGRLEVSTRYVGARRTTAGSALNLLDPYWLTDASAGVPLAIGRWTVDGSVGVTNIFDRPAAMLVDYPFGGRGWTVGVRVRRNDAAPR